MVATKGEKTIKGPLFMEVDVALMGRTSAQSVVKGVDKLAHG